MSYIHGYDMYSPYKYATEPFRPKQVVTKYLIPVTNISSLRILELHFELLKSFDFGSENNTHSLGECNVHELHVQFHDRCKT